MKIRNILRSHSFFTQLLNACRHFYQSLINDWCAYTNKSSKLVTSAHPAVTLVAMQWRLDETEKEPVLVEVELIDKDLTISQNTIKVTHPFASSRLH